MNILHECKRILLLLCFSAVSSPWFVSNELRHSFTALLRSLPSATGVLDQRYSEDPVTVGCIIQQHLFSTNMEVFCEETKSYFPLIRMCIRSHGFCSEKVNINVFMHFAVHSIATYASDFPRELSLSWGVDVAISAQRS